MRGNTVFPIYFIWISNLCNDALSELVSSQMHPSISKLSKYRDSVVTRENTADFWIKNGQDSLKKRVNGKVNTNVAKNVIMFLGDGLSIPTQTATRVYLGGEEEELSFEQFPYSALSKTYCVDAQTADSACTATAYLAGVKNNMGTIGVTGNVVEDDCEAMILEENQVLSIAKWSQNDGKRTGIVTTSTVTDASPAGAYAHTANRVWQSDTAVITAGKNATRCRDIAYQMIHGKTGKNFNVILGGGSNVFLPNDATDPLGSNGIRSDGINLIDEWLNDKETEGSTAAYVWNKTAMFEQADDVDYMLGLFSEGNMPYNLERDSSLTPSLEEMTEVSIKIASKGNGAENGYFLFIEGGRIDHAHHETWGKKSLDETAEFSNAIKKALELTNEEDTLIVVTADHSHTMSISGYPLRNNHILGAAGTDDYGITRLTLNYANGPGHKDSGHDYGEDDTFDDNYRFPSVSMLYSETHGADDVGIFANGPWAHLFSGVIEQSAIPHFMAYASCVGDGLTVCSGAIQTLSKWNIIMFSEVLLVFFLFVL